MNEQNPYSPPKAPVSEVETATASPTPNSHVELACKVLLLNLGLSVVSGLMELWTIYRTTVTLVFIGSVIGQAVAMVIAFLIVFWVIRKLRLARNWMRWLITALNIVGYLLMAGFWSYFKPIYAGILQSSPVAALLFITQSILGLVVLGLIHTPSARAWFAAHSPNRSA
jgi:hypothetical protein